MRLLQRTLSALVCSALLFQPALALEPRQVFSKASRSVVVVRTQNAAREELLLGSGVVIQSNIVATNCHVLKGASFINIRGGGAPVVAHQISKNIAQDICLLSAATDEFQVAEFAGPDSVQRGARVYSIGAPLGLQLTISEGLISGIRKTKNGYVIQTSAAISHGSSGGGLFNEEGKLVGFTTFFFGDSQNLNFAVPVQVALKALADVRRTHDQEAADVAAAGTAFFERTTALDNSIRNTLTRYSDGAPASRPAFDSMNGRLAYLRWLAEMSLRMRKRFPDAANAVDLLETVWYESTRAGLEPSVVLGLIETASGFRELKETKAGARGYMQVSTSWLTRTGWGNLSDLFRKPQNLRIGCSVLRSFLEAERGDLYLALARYHGQILGDQYRMEDKATNDFINNVFASQRQWLYLQPIEVPETVKTGAGP